VHGAADWLMEDKERRVACQTRLRAHLPEVLEDVVEEDLLRLVGVHSGERVHVDDRVLKAHQREAQSPLQGLEDERMRR